MNELTLFIPVLKTIWFKPDRVSLAALAMSGVAKAWMANEMLVARATHGAIAVMDCGKQLKRRTVPQNAKVISPVIALHGMRPTVDQIEEHVCVFFEMARPRGAPRATRFLSAFYFKPKFRTLSKTTKFSK